jgi:hypothetical protein
VAEQLTIDVAMTSWPNHPKRVEYIAQVLASLKSHLSASEHALRFYCSVETERDPRATWHGDDLAELLESYNVTWQSRGEPANLGANMNAAMGMGSGEFVYLQQDDWELRYDVDLSPGAALLARLPELDIVRYSWPLAPGMHPTLDGDVEGWRLIDVNGPWPYGDDPHLRRRDFMNRWGWYFEGGKHGTASGGLMKRLVNGRGRIVVAGKNYYQHIGYASAVLGDVRSGKNRRYE